MGRWGGIAETAGLNRLGSNQYRLCDEEGEIGCGATTLAIPDKYEDAVASRFIRRLNSGMRSVVLQDAIGNNGWGGFWVST